MAPVSPRRLFCLLLNRSSYSFPGREIVRHFFSCLPVNCTKILNCLSRVLFRRWENPLLLHLLLLNWLSCGLYSHSWSGGFPAITRDTYIHHSTISSFGWKKSWEWISFGYSSYDQKKPISIQISSTLTLVILSQAARICENSVK
jgi:hypothetical protein